MGGSSGGGGIVPFNIGALAPFMPSVFKGPYNAQGAFQNERMIAQKYPWITPPAGQFEGAQPGQFAGSSSGNNDLPGFFGNLPGVSGFMPPQNPNPPIPPTVTLSSQSQPPTAASTVPSGAGQNTVTGTAVNPGMNAQILAMLMKGGGMPPGGQQ